MKSTLGNNLFSFIWIFIESCFYVMCFHCEEADWCQNNSKEGYKVAPCIRVANSDGISRSTGFCDHKTLLKTYWEYSDGLHCKQHECKVVEKDYCKLNSPCENNGKCKPLFGSYLCICPPNYHSRHCSKSIKNGIKTVKGVYFIFSVYRYIQPIYDYFVLIIDQPGDKFKAVFSSGDSGEVIKLSAQHLRNMPKYKTECEKRFKKSLQMCRSVPDKTLAVATIPFDQIYILDNSVLEERFPVYNTPVPAFKFNKLSLKVYNDDSEEFSEHFYQLISFRQNICPRQVILIQNCGNSSEKPLQITRKVTRNIESIVRTSEQTYAECSHPETTFQWNIYTFQDTAGKTGFVKLVETSKADEAVYNIKKFTFPIGVYKVKLKVFIAGQSQREKEKYNAIYQGLCFFEIVKVPLVVNIEGGDSRTVSLSDHLILNATQSYDPNERRNKQPHLQWQWECNGTEVFCKIHTFNNGIYKIDSTLTEGLVLNFTVTLLATDGSNSPVKASQTVIILKDPQAQIAIECLKNCGLDDFKTNPKEVVYLQAKVTNNVKVNDFLWSYTVNGGLEKRNILDLFQPGTDSNILVIKRNVLITGSRYTFTVKSADPTVQGSSNIAIEVNKPPKGGNCSVTPQEGQKMVTQFGITCENFSVDHEITQLTYEFYQRSPQQKDPGTMLGFSTSGELSDLILTENYITIRVLDLYGMFTDVVLEVNLQDWELKNENVEQILTNLKLFGLSGDIGNSARIAGALIDLMQNVTEKLELINSVLDSLSRNCIRDFSNAKLYMSTVNKVVTKGVSQLNSGINFQTVKSLGRLISLLTKQVLRAAESENNKDSIMLMHDVEDIASTVLHCTDVIVNSIDNSIFNTSTGNLKMFNIKDHYKRGTADTVSALLFTSRAILSNILPQEQEIVVKSNKTVMWLKIDSPTKLEKLNGIPHNSSTKLNLSKRLAENLKNLTDNINLSVVTFKKNPYWWDLEDKDLASEVVSVQMWERSLITDIPEPLDIYLKVKTFNVKTIVGKVTMPSLYSSEDEKDAAVVVYTLAAPTENSNGKLFLRFLNLNTTILLVYISVNLRPDYNMMMSKGKVVDVKFPSLSLSYNNITADTLHFIGILPGPNVPTKQTVSYTLKLHNIQCKMREIVVWASPACKIGEETTAEVVHCKCSHMSFFGSSSFVAPTLIHPINDLHLLLTLEDNPLVFSFVLLLLTLYIVFLIWTKVLEKRDILDRKVIVLEDNFPGEKYSYLIVVYTGFNIGAATDSKVGIKLFGSEETSRSHILHSKNRKVFKKNADDWFLIFTPIHLGELESIHIWHDNSGVHADWCCKRVQVFDMKSGRDYEFLVEQWLTAWPGDLLEAIVTVASNKEIYNWKKMWVQNVINSIRENHLWASIFLCHPRAPIPKSHRLTMTYCVIMVTLLVGIAFYGIKNEKEDLSKYEIRNRDLVIAIESIIISTLITSLVLLCFKHSSAIKRIGAFNHHRNKVIYLESKCKDKNKTVKKNYCCPWFYVCNFHNIIKGKPLIPILVEVESPQSVIQRKKWLSISWGLSQICIWGSGFLIILYGLKLGKVLSEQWLTTALVSVLQSVLISTPLKICFVSSVYAMFGEKVNVQIFECHSQVIRHKKNFGDKKVLFNLLKIRSSPIYKPLSLDRCNQIKIMYIKKSRRLHQLEFYLTLLLFVTVILMTTTLHHIDNYHTTSHLSKSLTRAWNPSATGLMDVINTCKLTDYLVGTMIPGLFKGRWYNRRVSLTSPEESLQQTGWISDATHRLIGVPRIRQIRVKSVNCSCSFFFNKTALSLPALTEESEDTRDYGLEWGPISKYVNKPRLLPWTWQGKGKDSLKMFGESNLEYHSGGYIVELADTQRKCAHIVSDLMDLGWWNIHFRAFIMELSVYNPNTDSRSSVIIITEHLPSGAFTNRIQVFTVHFSYSISYLLFVSVLVIFNIRIFKRINRNGIFEITNRFWGFYDISLVIIGDASVFSEVISLLKYDGSIDIIFQELGENIFSQFTNTIYYYRLSKFLWCLMLCLVPIRLFKFKYFVYSCFGYPRYYETLNSRRKLVLTFCGCVMIAVYIQLAVIDFTISPTNMPMDIHTKFYKTSDQSHVYNFNTIFMSLMFATCYNIAVLIVQTLFVTRIEKMP